MFFKKKKKNSPAKKIDKIITGFIIGGAVAGIVGFSKTKKGKEMIQQTKEKSSGFFGKVIKFFGKTSIKILDILEKFKK